MKLVIGLLALMGLLAVACGGGDDGGPSDVFIEPDQAGRVAHAGLPSIDDLPGEGWQVTAEDQFETGEDGLQFLEYIEDEGACATLENLAALKDFFGRDREAESAAGRAQVEIERQPSDEEALIPSSVEAQVEIKQTTAEIEERWTLFKKLFESEATSDCVVAVLNKSFEDTGPAGGLDLEVEAVDSSAAAPQDGVSMAFNVGMTIADVELDMAMEMYSWPYGNAGVQAMFLGPADAVDKALVEETLKAMDSNLQAAVEGEG